MPLINSRTTKAFLVLSACGACINLSGQSVGSARDDALLRAFVAPPASAMPRVWWHWMNGNISEEGLRLDLDWMHRVGVAGVTIFEGANNTPQVLGHRLVFMTPEWKHAFNTAVSLAKARGMEVAIASSPGWSETGGPWVPPSQAMKKMVWSGTRIQGGKPFAGTLAHPPETSGYFQNVKGTPRPGTVVPQFYADAAVMAYRIPDGDKTQLELNPQVTASAGSPNVPALSDGDLNTVALLLPAGAAGNQPWVQFDYGRTQMIQAITLGTLDDMRSVFDHGNYGVPVRLEASDDGEHFRKIVDLAPSSVAQRTTAFASVKARYFRIVFTTPASSRPVADHKISELVLSAGARVNEFEKRAGYANVRDFYAIADSAVAPEFIVSPQEVMDLTGKMKPDGTLEWTPPEGKWMVLRIGYSLTGHQNGPAPLEATGLEVDKLNRDYVKGYMDGYLKMYSDTVGPSMMGRSGISHLLTDSIEVGPQNWTDNILEEFKQRRGYDARPWLPALTGVVIRSPVDSDRFLWDFRRTIAQLIAQNHYGEIAEELHRRGIHYYGEALEFHRPSLGDDMEMRSRTDIPMGAMWTYKESVGPNPTYVADLRGAASVAHIYGQNLVGAESMTAGIAQWSYFPGNLKRNADLQLALGVNRFMIHESTHEPVIDKAPGLTLGAAGQFFTRNETWAEQAGPWITYLGRSSFLLQQGHFYADVAYFYGEEGPLTAVFGFTGQTDVPEGFGFDFVNSDVILNRLAFEHGRLVTPGGTSYRILYLGGTSRRMTLPVLRRIRDLVALGAVIAGNKPVDSPSLSDDQKEFQRIADQLWGQGDAPIAAAHQYRKGWVYSGQTANETLAALQVPEDFQFAKPEADTDLMFVHRRLADGEIYFVDNRKDRPETLAATFRVAGRSPELWDAATGTSKPVSYRTAHGLTTVPLQLDPYGAVFVVFRGAAAAPERQLPPPVAVPVSTAADGLDRGWIVRFQSGRGAPAAMPFDRLTSWTENADDFVKYFSGTATYTKSIEAHGDWFKPGAHLWLNLGAVGDVAEVAVNGKALGILWKKPYAVDLTGALRPGSNQLTIKVTNVWVNRLIGDQQPWAIWKYTFTDIKIYQADSPLLPSGLMGPLEISSVAPDSAGP
jgi:hypothetical protein